MTSLKEVESVIALIVDEKKFIELMDKFRTKKDRHAVNISCYEWGGETEIFVHHNHICGPLECGTYGELVKDLNTSFGVIRGAQKKLKHQNTEKAQ